MKNKDYIKKEYDKIKKLLKDKKGLSVSSYRIISFANYLIEKKEEEYYFKLLSLIRFELNSNEKCIKNSIFSEVLNEDIFFNSKCKKVKPKLKNFELSYIDIKKRIKNKKDIISYSKSILSFSKELLEKKEYSLHEKLASLIRFTLRENNSNINKKSITFCISFMLHEEGIINEELYNKYKEQCYCIKINKKEKYYYLKDNEYLFNKYYKNLKMKNKLKYNIEYFINDFEKNKEIIKIKFSKIKRKVIIKSI